MNRLRPSRAFLVIAALALVACAAPDVTVKSITAPSGVAAFAVSCEKGPELCDAEANRLCPKGHRTLEPGKGGWYKPELGPARATTERHPGDVYRQVDWVVACD
jgi:hypothetical protein